MWLKLIGDSERARKLRARVDGLVSPPVDPNVGPEPAQCPTTVLFGAEVARKLYADPNYRSALDAWDTGEVSRSDLRRYCQWIEKGLYAGPIFYPDASWLSALRILTTRNALRMESRKRIPDPLAVEFPRWTDREQRLA